MLLPKLKVITERPANHAKAREFPGDYHQTPQFRFRFDCRLFLR